jgi:hypothetical protein
MRWSLASASVVASLSTLLVAGCGGSGATAVLGGDSTATVTSMGANATHDHYSGIAASGDWNTTGAGTGMLVAVSTNLEQALSFVLVGPVPAPGARYALDESGGGSLVKYADAPGSHGVTRVWASTGGSVTVDALTPSTSDHSTTLRVSFADVTAEPATDAFGNQASGKLTLKGMALIEGVYLPAR